MMGIITNLVMKPAEAVVPSNSVSRTGIGSRQVGILLFCANAMSINEWEDPESIRVTIFETSFDDKGIDNEFEEGIALSLTALSKTVCMCSGRVQHSSHVVFYHSGSGRISLVFGQDPSHSDETFVPYMRYDPPCTTTRLTSFASNHLNCLRPSRTEPSRAMHHRIFLRQTVNYHARHEPDSELRLLLLRRQGSRSLWKGRQ